MSGIVGDNTGTGSGQIATVQGITTSSSDPAVDTNPDGGLGTVWANTTSGEMYACTDATAGSNVWTNMGDGTGDIAPYVYAGSSYAYAVAGSWPVIKTIDKYSLSSDGDGVYANFDLTASKTYMGSQHAQSLTHGFIFGGYTSSATNVIEKFSFSVDATAVDIGNLTTAHYNVGGCNSQSYAYRLGGGDPSADVIDRVAMDSGTDAADVGDLIGEATTPQTNTEGDTYGYLSGSSNATHVLTVQKVQLVSSANSVDTGSNLTVARAGGGTSSSTTHGYTAGGPDAPPTVTIDRYAFGSSSDATDVGDLAVAVRYCASASSTTHGYNAGNATGSTKDIEKYSYASSASGSRIGDLSAIHKNGGGCHV